MISIRFLARGSGSSKSLAACSGSRCAPGTEVLIDRGYTAGARALPWLPSVAVRAGQTCISDLMHFRRGSDIVLHSCTHPEGWRDWPDEAPATTADVTAGRCQFQLDVWRASALRHTLTPAKNTALRFPRWLQPI